MKKRRAAAGAAPTSGSAGSEIVATGFRVASTQVSETLLRSLAAVEWATSDVDEMRRTVRPSAKLLPSICAEDERQLMSLH